jgi:hypothetical protein
MGISPGSEALDSQCKMLLRAISYSGNLISTGGGRTNARSPTRLGSRRQSRSPCRAVLGGLQVRIPRSPPQTVCLSRHGQGRAPHRGVSYPNVRSTVRRCAMPSVHPSRMGPSKSPARASCVRGDRHMVELHDISVDFLFRESVQVKSSWSNAHAAQSPRAGTLPQAGHARVGSVTPPAGRHTQ